MADRIEAHLTVQPDESRPREEFVAVGILVNTGTESVVLNLAPLTVASLALEIVDAKGAPVLLTPPPVPDSAVRTVEIAPGKSHTVRFEGFVPQWIPIGAYRVRLRYMYRAPAPSPREWTGYMVSDWAKFRIVE